MLIQYAAITHKGRVRKNNEDAYLVSALDGEEPLVNGLRPLSNACHAGLLVAVADGMGGAAAGEIASREGLLSMAVNLFGRWGRFPASEHREADLWQALKTSAEEASHAVLRYSDEERTARGMGSTLTAAVIWDGHAYLAQVGDSRAYLFRQGQFTQLTTDQTLVNEMVTSGMLTEEQAKTHPQRSMITQALGAPQALNVALAKVPIRRGDRLLLCSDGLHGEASDSVLHAILAKHLSPKATLEAMLESALEHGGRDNITGLLLSLEDPGLPLPTETERVRILPPGKRELGEQEPGFLTRISRKLVGRA